MRVGQRAYLTISGGTARISSMLGVTGFEKGSAVAGLTYDFVISNLGQTPASALAYKMDFVAPPGWELQPNSHSSFSLSPNVASQFEDSLGDVPQSGSIPSRRGSATFYLNQAAWDYYVANENRKTKPDGVGRTLLIVTLLGTLTYRDVFGDRHTIQWCWLVGEEDDSPSSCEHFSSIFAQMAARGARGARLR